MSSVNVRISSGSYNILKSISKGKGQSMQSVIDRALEDLRRREVLEAANSAFSALRSIRQLGGMRWRSAGFGENTLADGIEVE